MNHIRQKLIFDPYLQSSEVYNSYINLCNIFGLREFLLLITYS